MRSVLFSALAVSSVAVAAEGDRWYVTPEIGGISPDYRRSLVDHDWLFGLAGGRELGPVLNLELNVDGTRLNRRAGNGHLYQYDASVDALGVLNRAGVISPYLIVGAGVLRNEFSGGPQQTHFAPEAGLGLFLNLWHSPDQTRGFALRPQVKARWDNPGRDRHLVDYLATLGFQFSFGGSPVARAAEAPPPPAPVPPPPPPVAQPAPPPPPVTPAPEPDSDHDGVPDSLDKCPNTPPGVQVDATGCPLKGKITLEGVTFAHNSADLTSSSDAVLDQLADGLKKHPRLRVEIQGHTDSTGAAAYNMKLSQKRADAVRSYLVNAGVDPTQLVARGYGASQPFTSNATAEGRARNRRVVMYVLSNPGDVNVEGEGSTD
jgi:outer membrane protein OmpA-like peptidoglycan-associated protein